MLSSGGGVGYLIAFSYSGDGGASWSTPQGALERRYVFKTYAGWGTFYGQGNVVTGECDV